MSNIITLPASAHGYALANIVQQQKRSIIYICNSDREMQSCADSCQFFAKNTTVLTLPAWDCLPYDRVSPAHHISAERIDTLCQLAQHTQDHPVIVITTISAAMQRIIPKSLLRDASFTIKTGDELDRDAMINFLIHNGYSRVSKCMEPGEFALRGSIIDLYAPSSDDAVRIDLFGDEIETLKLFDPLSQVSHAKIDELTLRPVSETLLNEDTITRFRTRYRETFGAVTKHDPLYEHISENRHYAGMEHWLPLFYESLDTIFDYIPNATLCIDHLVEQTRIDRLEMLQDYYDTRKSADIPKQETPYHPIAPETLYLLEEQWKKAISNHNQLTFSPFKQHEAEAPIKAAPDFAAMRKKSDQDVFDALGKAAKSRNHPTLIACYSAGSLDRIHNMAEHHNITCQILTSSSSSDHRSSRGSTNKIPDTCDARSRMTTEISSLAANAIGLIIMPIEHGFETDEFLLLSEQDILGERIIRTQKRRRKSEAFMEEAASFSDGEYIVHKENGIGRFEGLVTMQVSGHKHDCLKLVYAGDDKLFLPVVNMDMISRYGSEAEGVQLDKLGATSWQKRKANMKKRIKVAAEELLKIAAKRMTRAAPILEASPNLYDEFCQRFPFSETDDQQQAIDDVLADLASGKPMDRLICGDVGFGKTEVALRAAFAAVAGDEPVQVAIVAPTTLLVRQHAKNFAERFEGMPVTVRSLSRMVSAKQASETKDMLKEGKVDIVIGTHALLSKGVEFKNLGLVIVDEEQHFGVAQKERLKRMRTNTHVLTLSATPIPRTLQMSLSGVRELSLITTPPVDRLAIRSFVMPYDGIIIREAILREVHRGGRVFYVTPRIKYMAELKVRLSELVPEIKIAAAHGQMSPKELDTIMNDFYDGKYDLLLSTAIIESGLDIPTANTMIIDHPEMFGLSQLYQMRGRVGRGKIRAYAYFTLPHKKTLTNNAVKRLEVMQTLDTLGAGFTLASHDMDIRGFGNLLGEEQSGHVNEVGIELYQTMLEETIEQLRSGHGDELDKSDDDWSPQINIGSSMLIPESYIEDLSLRMNLYRRLASMHDAAEIDSFVAELIDRFGALPDEVKQLIEVLRIKQLCKRAGIERLDTGPKGAVITFRNNSFDNPQALLQLISQQPQRFKFRHDQKLVYMASWKNGADRLNKVGASVEAIANLAA